MTQATMSPAQMQEMLEALKAQLAAKDEQIAALSAKRTRELSPEALAKVAEREAARAAFVKYATGNEGVTLIAQEAGGETTARVLARAAKRLPYQQAAEFVAMVLEAIGGVEGVEADALFAELAEVKPRKKKGEAEAAPEATEA